MSDNSYLSGATSVVPRNIMFATDANKTKSDYYLKGDPVSLIANNIASFMGGRADPWGSGKDVDMALVNQKGGSVEDEDMEAQY